MVREYDLLVVGSGPAGIHAAVQAAKLRKKVAIIEGHPNRLGGSWLHTGTIPSKTMREVLAAIQSIKPHMGQEWVARIVNTISSKHLKDRALHVSREEENLIRRHLANNKIEIIPGFARIEDSHTLRVNHESQSRLVSASYIMLATGSKPRRPAEIPFDDWRIVDSDGILRLETIPRSILIYGAGVIGCEYACILGALGVETTIIDSRTQMMQSVDKELAEALKLSMEEMGIRFRLGLSLDQVQAQGPMVTAVFQGETLAAEVFFFAAGRESSTHALGLDRVGIATDVRGTIKVNEYFQTAVPNIYAAGDVIGAPALASVSMEQGRFAACHAFGTMQKEFPRIFPIGIYTIPELSSVGKTEEELRKENVDYVVGRASFDEIARGFIRGDNHGLVKILACAKTQKILGIHILGADAANLIHIGQCCMMAGMSLSEIVNSIIFNYPTLAESYRIAAFNALNKIKTNGMISPGKSNLEDKPDVPPIPPKNSAA